MILYHFPTSPFARRVRLALAHKGLTAELRDARDNAEHRAEVHRLHPMQTIPVLVDGDRVVVESAAILQYLDRKWPDPPMWPEGIAGAEAFEVIGLVDGAIQIIADLGMRYASLATHENFDAVRAAAIARVQRALDALAERVGDGGEYLCGNRWSAADMAVFAFVAWLEGLPARVDTFVFARNLLALGWSVPTALGAWAERQRTRVDVAALDQPPR